MLSVAFFINVYAEYRYVECRCAECRGAGKNARVDFNYVFASYPWVLLQKIGKPE